MSQSQIDAVENFEGALIQHGPSNDRIYLMKIGRAAPEIAEKLVECAHSLGYGKIFAKIPGSSADCFLRTGYEEEARIDGFFNGEESGLFLAYFLKERRRRSTREAEENKILSLALNSAQNSNAGVAATTAGAEKLGRADIQALGKIYREVFPKYPFPIQEEAYLEKTMNENVEYFGIKVEGVLVAASSAEKDLESRSVEMTDFAVSDKWRGKSFSRILLRAMEKEMSAKGFRTAYTIARALSAGINKTFASENYAFNGRLVNNTNIFSGIESMNVWSKGLR